MAFTLVTISHDFDPPAGAVGTVSFTPVEPLHNAGHTVTGTTVATLNASGVLSQQVAATTDPGTTPTGAVYRMVIRISGQPTAVCYSAVPHNQGATLDLATLLAWAQAGPAGGVVTTVNGYTGTVVLDADDIADGDLKAQMTAAERTKLAGVATGANLYTDEQARDTIGATLVAGTNVTITPNDAADTITIAAAGGSGYTDEQARDAVGAALVAGAAVTITVNDAADTITIASTAGYATVQDEGSGLTARGTLNFTGRAVAVADNSGSTRTDVTVLDVPLVHAVGNSGTTLTIDASSSSGYVKTITLTGNCTFTLSGAVSGQATTLELVLTQDATGSRTVTWPASVKWSGGAPTLSTAASAVDRVVLTTYNAGTTWYGDLVGKGYA